MYYLQIDDLKKMEIVLHTMNIVKQQHLFREFKRRLQPLETNK